MLGTVKLRMEAGFRIQAGSWIQAGENRVLSWKRIDNDVICV